VPHEATVRQCFAAWQNRDWDALEPLLADGFRFTTPYDDHLDVREYKRKCWDAVTDIAPFEYLAIVEQGDQAFVRYRGQVNGTRVHNTEHFRFEDGKIKAVEVFFGRPEDAPAQGT
jgi:ketosteroid isomerase-like protein